MMTDKHNTEKTVRSSRRLPAYPTTKFPAVNWSPDEISFQ